MGTFIYLIVFGLLFGVLARAMVPGKDSMGLGGTLLLGVVGSLVGGFLGRLIFSTDLNDGWFQASGLIGSLVGSVIALLAYRQFVKK